MNVALTDDLEQLLRSKVENGQYPDEESVVREALRRFLIDAPSDRGSRTSGVTAPVEKRQPSPFLDDTMTVAPHDLPRSGREIACDYRSDEKRQPDVFPRE